jgi:hypothetical protein
MKSNDWFRLPDLCIRMDLSPATAFYSKTYGKTPFNSSLRIYGP